MMKKYEGRMKYYLRELFYTIRLVRHQIKWRKINTHNNTVINSIINNNRIRVGKNTYGKLNVIAYNTNGNSKLVIGNFCSISSTAIFMLGGGHNLRYISSYPFKNKILGMDESIEKGDIVIDDDVWIGENATVMSGVHIGQGAVVGACSLVTKDVPDYAVVVGVPAKILRYRFDDMIIRELRKIDFAKLNEDWIKENIDIFYREVDLNIIKRIREEGCK